MGFDKLTNTACLPSIELSLPGGKITMHMPGDPSIAALRPTLDANCVNASSSVPVPPSEQLTTSRIPPNSNLFVPPHWHETHTEIFRVVQGFALLRLGNRHLILEPDDGPVEILPFTIHGFGRADGEGVDHRRVDEAWRDYMSRKGCGESDIRDKRNGSWRSDDVILDEWTDPLDGEKEVFFRNIFSTYSDLVQPSLVGLAQGGSIFRQGASLLQLLPSIPTLMHLSAFVDNYPVIGGEMLGVSRRGGPSTISWMVSHTMFAIVKAVGRLMGWKFWREEYTPAELRPVCKSMENR